MISEAPSVPASFAANRRSTSRVPVLPVWVHNRFRDLDERWRSASTGRRTACPTYFAKRLIQQGGAGGFACRSNGHNQWSASKLNKFPRTVKHPECSRKLSRNEH